jgi:hypothetical protein
MALPTLTPEQRAEALEKAQAARSARKQLLDQVKAGELTVAQVLARKNDPIVAKTKVSALVQAVPGWGVVRAVAVLAEAKIPEGRRVGGLGTKQHEALLSALS